jgi:chromosome segregation ATPase
LQALNNFWQTKLGWLGGLFARAGKRPRKPERPTRENDSSTLTAGDVSNKPENIEDRHASQLAELRRQLTGYAADRSTAGHQLEALTGALEELSSRIDGIASRVTNAEAAGNAARQQVEAFNITLAETTSRVDGTESRITDIETARNAARQRVETLENTLAETSARLEGVETRIMDAGATVKATRHQIETLKITLTETTSRLDGMESRIADAEAGRDAALQRVETFENTLAETTARLDSAESRVSTLDRQLEKERAEHRAEMQKTQALADKQQRRSRWLLGLVVFGLIQAGVAGVIWIRNNAEILAGINRDIQDIRTSLVQPQVSRPGNSEGRTTTRTAP